MGNLFETANVSKLPFEKSENTSRNISSCTFLSGVHWRIGINYVPFLENDINRRVAFAAGDTVFLYGLSGNIYKHPIKGTITSSTQSEVELDLDNPQDITSFAGGWITKDFQTDCISSVMDSHIQVNSFDYQLFPISYNSNVVTAAIDIELIAGYYNIMITDQTSATKYYFTKYLIANVDPPYYRYSFTDDNSELYNADFMNSVIMIMHVGAKYNVQVLSDGLLVGSFYYTPDKDFKFSMNLKPILSSLFDKRLFTETTDPLSTSFANIQNLSSVFMRKVSLIISLGTPNKNDSGTLQFWTAPFRSTTGRPTLEEYLPPVDSDYRKPVTLFNKVSYTNGIGGLMMFGYLLRMRDGILYSSGTTIIDSTDDVPATPETLLLDKNYIHFILYTKKYTSAQFPDTIKIYTQGDETRFISLQVYVKNLGLVCGNINLIWQGMTGVNSWFFEPEYDEDWNVNDAITITNNDENTITNYNTMATRKLTIKARMLSKDDKLGVSTILEAKQIWIYSPTQTRLLPAKLLTKTAKIRQSDENKYDFSCDIEIQQGVTL